MKHLSIGLDGGHSMFKVRAGFLEKPDERISLHIPTAVIQAMHLTNERSKQQALADTVHCGGASYFIGQTALRQGELEAFTGQNSSWVETTEHDVLIVGAWKRIMEKAGKGPMRIILVLGLPAKFFDAQKGSLKKRVTKLLAPLLNHDQHLKVMIQSQGEAPLQWLALNPDGKPSRERNLDEQVWGVIEIGHFTTDFALCDRGTMIERAAGSCAGRHLVYDAVSQRMARAGLSTTIEHVDMAIRNKKFLAGGEPIDLTQDVLKAESVFNSTVLDHAVRVFDKQRRMLDGIVVAGGGAPGLFGSLKENFKQCITDDEPRHVVAEGLCRVGLLALFQQSAR
jgi:plasmid segregation protein ParM